MNKKNKDIKFGNQKENNIIPKINKYFKCNIIKTDPFYEFDFIDKELKLLFELKSRRNIKSQYKDTMIGENKIIEGNKMIDKGYKVYFIFDFIDCIEYYELIKKIPDNWMRKGGRTDRGKIEIKNYCYIPNNELINLFLKKDNTYNILPIMNPLKPKTSYSQRLIDYFKEHDSDNFDIETIEKIINDFSKQEYEKKKEKSDEMPFGKYKFRKVEEVAKFDKQYLKWLIKQDMLENWTELKNEINKFL